MTRLVLSVFLIFISLALGYIYRQRLLLRNKDLLLPLRDRLQFLAFFLFMPLSSMFSLWGLPKPDERFLALPLLGILAWTLGGAASLLAAYIFRFSKAAKGSLFCCGTFPISGLLAH